MMIASLNRKPLFAVICLYFDRRNPENKVMRFDQWLNDSLLFVVVFVIWLMSKHIHSHPFPWDAFIFGTLMRFSRFMENKNAEIKAPKYDKLYSWKSLMVFLVVVVFFFFSLIFTF